MNTSGDRIISFNIISCDYITEQDKCPETGLLLINEVLNDLLSLYKNFIINVYVIHANVTLSKSLLYIIILFRNCAINTLNFEQIGNYVFYQYC